MKTANQIREYVRRRSLIERSKYNPHRILLNMDEFTELKQHFARVRELAFIEILNAFDTPHKTRLKMPPMARKS